MRQAAPHACDEIAALGARADLDMFSATPTPFLVDQVVEHVQRYAERIYTTFRRAVTDGFLLRYGGEP